MITKGRELDQNRPMIELQFPGDPKASHYYLVKSFDY